jgi:cobalt-zinc-cadmium efflux system outer membrane protein
VKLSAIPLSPGLVLYCALPLAAQELSLGVPALEDPPRFAQAPAEPLPIPASDQPPAARLTLADAEGRAVASHPALREMGGRLDAARGNWVQVGLRPNPEIGYMGNEIGDEGKAGQQGGFVSKEFITGGKLGLNRAVAAREQAMAEQRLEITRLQVITTTRINFYEDLAAERNVALTRQLSEIAAESLRVSDLRLKALDIPRSSLLQSQVESDSTILLEQQAQERHTAAWRRLAAVIGAPPDKPLLLEDALVRPLPELDWETQRSRLMAESPELSELQFNVERAKAAVQRATAGRVPNVDLQSGVLYDAATEDTIANVQLSMPLQVFDRNQGAIAQACGELVAAQAALDRKQLELEQRLAAALRDYQVARERVTKIAIKILPVARESLDIANAGYREGELEYIQVLAVQQTYAEKNLAYLADLETAWKKWAEIDGLLVGPLPAGTE